MGPPKGRLLELVQMLDALGASPSMIDLAAAMASVKLTLGDVEPYIRANPRAYNRALVALREHYELLVMTWLPGQASDPHDHAGSICVMQVLQGEAIEGSYRVAPDGYVDLDYDTLVPCGEITAGQDAGVHTVFNPGTAKDFLVTVHAYAPPLKDFRRFVRRPTVSVVNSAARDGTPTVVIVGGGFSGSITAAQMLRQAKRTIGKVRVVVVERRGSLGEGLAYGTREWHHLLNVPAGKMSAWPDRPDDFVQWTATQGSPKQPGDFVPRPLYGQYVRETLITAARESSPVGKLEVVFDEVRRVARRPEGGWLVHLARSASWHADAVVLAVGHRPPSDQLGQRWSGSRTRLIADPWRPFAMNAVEPDQSVMILGAGLTAVDAVLSLAHPNRTAPITILSRRGLLPQSHAASPQPPIDLKSAVDGLLARAEGMRGLDILRLLRGKARELAPQGIDWRSVVDGLRPHTATLWQAMSAAEKRRFVARLRPYWEVHRHRMALSIGERFGELLDCDLVEVVAGRIVSARGENDEVHIAIAERGTSRLREFNVDWVVNCTGPAPSNSAGSNPAIGSLLVDGWLRPDELGLGIETVDGGNAVDARGEELPNLFVVGTLRKPMYWESTAVPELRAQAAAVAGGVLELLKTRDSAGSRPA